MGKRRRPPSSPAPFGQQVWLSGEEVLGKPSTLADVVARLRKMPRVDVTARLVELLSLLDFHEPSACIEKERTFLRGRYFRPELQRIIDTFDDEAGVQRPVFHRRQLLVALLLAQRHCPDQGSGTFADVGEVLLRISDCIPDPEAPDSLLELLPVVAFVMPLYCDGNPPDPHLGLLRVNSMLADHAWDTVDGLRVARQRFRQRLGLTERDYLAILFPLTHKFRNLPESLKPPKVSPEPLFTAAPDGDALRNVFSLLSVPLDQLASDLPSDDQQILEDRRFEPIRSKPLLELPEGGFVCSDAGFLDQRLAVSFKWTLHDLCETEREREGLRRDWSKLLENYFHIRMASLLGANYIPHPQDENGDEITDALVDCGADVIVMEYKSAVVPDDVKFGGDPSSIERCLEEKFVRKSQLYRAVNRLFGPARLASSFLRDAGPGSRGVERVWPVLVSEDPAVCTPGVEMIMEGLLRKCAPPALPRRPRIERLHVLCADDLQSLFCAFRRGAKFINILRERDRADPRRLGTFHNFVISVFGRMGIERPFEREELDALTDDLIAFWKRQGEAAEISW